MEHRLGAALVFPNQSFQSSIILHNRWDPTCVLAQCHTRKHKYIFSNMTQGQYAQKYIIQNGCWAGWQ